MNLKSIITQHYATLVDVREPFEFIFGHAKGAVNIPLRKVLTQQEKFRKMKKPIVLYCRSGNRSHQAMLILKARGFEEVYNGGGLKDIKAILKSAA